MTTTQKTFILRAGVPPLLGNVLYVCLDGWAAHRINNNKNQLIRTTVIIATLLKKIQTKLFRPGLLLLLLLLVYHCCQLKSSLVPNTMKKPRMVEKITRFPVSTSAHAPQSICRQHVFTLAHALLSINSVCSLNSRIRHSTCKVLPCSLSG